MDKILLPCNVMKLLVTGLLDPANVDDVTVNV